MPALEGLSIVTTGGASPWWAAWTDVRTARVVLSLGHGRSVFASLGTGEHGDPVLVLAGTTPVVAWVHQRGTSRFHDVATGDALATRCEQPEGIDDGMTLTAAAIHGGASILVAWDEDRPVDPAEPARVTGAVLSQVVPTRGAHGVCPVPRVLSAPGQDAGDPVSVALPGGAEGAAVFWLASQTVQAADGNDSATDVWGVALDALGTPRGTPLRVTSPPARRFGLQVRAAGGALWLTYRVAADSDNEGRGDGGDVVAVRVDLAVTHAGPAEVVTPDEANPTGSPAVLADARGVEVWWLDRRQEQTVAVRRALDAMGRPTGAPADEAALGAELPVWRAGDEVTTPVLRGNGAGAAHFRCPWLPR